MAGNSVSLSRAFGGGAIHLHDVGPKQRGNTKHREDLQNLPGILCAHLCLHKVGGRLDHGREASRRHVLLHEFVLLVPLVTQPQVKLLLVVERDVCNTETAPVEVDGFRRTTFKVSAIQPEELLSVFASANDRLWLAAISRQ